MFFFCFSISAQSASLPDTVQCGGCRASYPLGEIVRFIEHKVNHCRSSLPGCHSPAPAAAPEDSDPEDALAVKAAEQEKINAVPSISAPIINKRAGIGGGSSSSRVESPPTPHGSSSTSDANSPIELRASSTPKRRTEININDDNKDDIPKKQKTTESVDADTNTVNSGENCFIFYFYKNYI